MTTVTGTTPDTTRLSYLDNLKTLMVIWIIVGHALLSYAATGGWAYNEVGEATFSPGVELGLAVTLGTSGLFLISVFFFVAGLLAPGSLDRRGPGRYARERLLRLGIPFLASALVVWPLSVWATYRLAGRPVSFWWVLAQRGTPLDSGALWFAEVLLFFSVVYAAWRRLAARSGTPAPRPLGARELVLLAGAMAATSFVVRLWIPARSSQIGDLHLWQWPQCAGMFVFGLVAARAGWLTAVPTGLWRWCGVTALATVCALPLIGLSLGINDLTSDVTAFLGGWRWQPLSLAVMESVLVVTISVWLLGVAQRLLTATTPRSARWTRAAFAAFVLQGPVLLLSALAVRPLPLPAEAKAVLVGVAGVAGSFWLGGLLVTRTRLGRLL